MERETGFEPATSSLGSWHSTAELLPRSSVLNSFYRKLFVRAFFIPSVKICVFPPLLNRKMAFNQCAWPRVRIY